MDNAVSSCREDIAALCRRYGEKRLDVSGSAAAGGFAPKRSDLVIVHAPQISRLRSAGNTTGDNRRRYKLRGYVESRRMPADKRLVLQIELLERALARLEDALQMPETAIVRDAAIKRFEFTFEMAWKSMYRWLRFKGVEIPEEAFEVIPRAFNAGLIDDDVSWTKIRRARNMTAHTYDEKKAVEVAASIRGEAAPRFRQLLDRLLAEVSKA